MSHNRKFHVVQFSAESLLEELNYGNYPSDHIKNNNLYKYLLSFLQYSKEGGHRVKSMVIERKYLSRSFFKDYVDYYAGSFNSYEKFTKRIHFFDIHIKDEESFLDLIINNEIDNKEFNNFYLGYVVVKPLLNSFIGGTFLKPYTPLDRIRHYNSKIKLPINVFGRNIVLEGCPFQEQDEAVSACASSALWTTFYITSQLFYNDTPSPSEITKSAGVSNFGERIFPSNALDNRQIARAIEGVGLTSEIRLQEAGYKLTSLDNLNLRRMIYAYNRVGLPVLLGYELKEGLHLVAIVGYRLYTDSDRKTLISSSSYYNRSFKFKSDYIKRFYAHNDQVGCYVKIDMEGSDYDLKVCNINDESRNATTHSIIIPLKETIRINYEKIRIGVDEISKISEEAILIHKALMLDKQYKIFDVEEEELLSTGKIEWDVFLEKSSNYKEQILNDQSISRKIKEKVVETCYPRFIWMARCYIIKNDYTKEILLFDLIYDPTGAPTGFCCFQSNFHHKKFAESFIEALELNLENILNGISIEDDFVYLSINHLEFFKESLVNKEEEFLENLRKFKYK